MLAAESVLVLVEVLAGRPVVSAPALLVAVATVAATGWRGAVTAGAGAAVVLLAAPATARAMPTSGLAATLGFCLAAVSTGMYVNAARERRLRGERERLLRAEAAVTHERLRIARELHDIVAHHLSLVVLQAGAARLSLPAGADALPAIQAAETASRRALDEMRRMVGVLRLRDLATPTDRAPQPTLRDLPHLLDQARAAGLTVTPDIDADLDGLPDGVELSAYRIVQEALTNVIRHAGGARTTVAVHRRTDRLELHIRNQAGVQPQDPPSGTGLGLLGMRERATLHGGRCSAGPELGGGFLVSATLPLGAPR